MMYLFELPKKYKFILRRKARLVPAILISTSLLFGFSGQANAACAWCAPSIRAADSYIWQEAENNFDAALNRSFQKLQSLIVHDLWEQSVLPAMMLAAEQLTAVAMQQVMTIGMFIDAENQLNAQRLLQEIRAKAHKDYHPSVGMCEFGSLMKSIAASERRGEVTAVILSQRSQDRQLGKRDTSAMYGNDLDKRSRIAHFQGLFCNIKDRSNVLINTTTALLSLCDTSMMWDGSLDDKARDRINKDIDYFSLVDSPWTLSIDFTNKKILDTSSTPNINNEDEEHILAMSSNLYAYDTFPRIPYRLLTNRPNAELTDMQKSYLDMRAIIAKRSVAENSFYAISAMKAEGNKANSPSGGGGCTISGSSGNDCTGVAADGTPSTANTPVSGSIDGSNNARVYMEHILKNLGVPSAEALQLLGDNPSYYAQMEILTKKIYQNPSFYTNLYDTPANIERKTVALQAINLMQKFDMLKSLLRGEVSTSILLELAVSDLQQEIEDQIQIIDVGN